jgi:hypothetical protein
MIPKEIMKLYEKLAFSRGYEEAFRDFLDVCLYYLSVGMLAEDYRRVEKRYKPYEMELFVQMFYRVSEYSEGFCDVLGDMFMECVSHGNNEQFFTPIHVADLMACMGGNRLKPKQSVCDSSCGSGRMLLSAVKKCAEENDGGRLFCYGSDIDLICVKMTVVNLMMNSVPGEVAWMNTLTMQHWRSYHIDLQLIAGVWLPILKITEAGDTSFIRKLENAMEDNSELKRSIQSNARATQLTFDF